MSEIYYVLEKFAEIDRCFVSIIAAMPIKRKAIDVIYSFSKHNINLQGIKIKTLHIAI